MAKLLTPIENATMELFGGRAAPWDPNTGGGSDTGGSVAPPELLVGMSTPFSYDGEWRRAWMQLKKNAPGSYLKSLDLYCELAFPQPV